MAIVLHGYYDGTGCQEAAHRGELIGLAGYSASPEVWQAFEAEWWRVLADDNMHPKCAYFHAKEAKHLTGEFAPEKGWNEPAVQALITELFNRCFSPFGRHDLAVEDVLIGGACTVDLHAYRRVCQQYPHFAEKKPEALCVDHVIGLAIKHLIPSDVQGMYLRDMTERRRSMALFFDRNEPFKRHLWRVWEPLPWAKRSFPMKLVHTISETDIEASAALQAADFLAWHTNRDVAAKDGDPSSRAMTLFASRCFLLHYDEEKLLDTAQRSRSGG